MESAKFFSPTAVLGCCTSQDPSMMSLEFISTAIPLSLALSGSLHAECRSSEGRRSTENWCWCARLRQQARVCVKEIKTQVEVKGEGKGGLKVATRWHIPTAGERRETSQRDQSGQRASGHEQITMKMVLAVFKGLCSAENFKEIICRWNKRTQVFQRASQ